MTTLSDFVDIGGECFNVTGTTELPPSKNETNATKSYDLICKSKTEFEKTYRSIITNIPDAIRLIRTYLPYQRPQLQGIQEQDKRHLKQIIEARMTSLQASLQHNNRSIKNMQFDQYERNLKNLLKDIDLAEATPSTTSLPNAQQRVKDKLSKERVYYILMELAWYLLHPDMIKTNADSWMKLLDTVETLNLGSLVKEIHKTNQHTMSIDMERVEKATILDASTLSPPDDTAELKQRLESILHLFVARKYLKAPLRTNTKGPIVNDETVNLLKSRLPQPMKGGANNTNGMNVNTSTINNTTKVNSKNEMNVNSFKISSESVATMMKPFYDFFKQKYDPVTSVLSKESSKDLPDGLSLVSLSKLLFICQKITSQSPIHHGIYRITNIDPVTMEFLRTQLGAVQVYVNAAERTDEERKSFIDMAGFVPIVSIKSLLNKFGKSGHYTDPETIPTVRIMIMGINLESSKEEMKFDKDAHKMDFDNAVHDFFKEQAIYLVCNEAVSTQTPMNVSEVDYPSVNVSKNTWELNELKDHYFNEVRKPELFLETVMDVKSNIVYNHGMLALSMFIASEELLPK